MDQILVEIALDGRIRYAIGALAGLGFAMVGLALLPQFLAEWPSRPGFWGWASRSSG